MKYRKQTQHIRRYMSGRAILVNRGIFYKKRKKPNPTELYKILVSTRSFGSTPRQEIPGLIREAIELQTIPDPTEGQKEKLRYIVQRLKEREKNKLEEEEEMLMGIRIMSFKELPKEMQLKRIKHLQALIYGLQTDLEKWKRKKKSSERAVFIESIIKEMERTIKKRLDLLNKYITYYEKK